MSVNWSFLPEIGNDVPLISERSPFTLPQSDESDFFAQGGAEYQVPANKSLPESLSMMDRTLTVRVRNQDPAPLSIRQSVIFGSVGQPQPGGIFVDVRLPDLDPHIFGLNAPTQELVRKEIVGNPFTIQGMRILFYK